jgi:hypothetical protein
MFSHADLCTASPDRALVHTYAIHGHATHGHAEQGHVEYAHSVHGRAVHSRGVHVGHGHAVRANAVYCPPVVHNMKNKKEAETIELPKQKSKPAT